MADIHKAMGILIRDRKVLVSRSKGKTVFIGPGGKLEDGETAQEALVRELHEELQIQVRAADLQEFGTFSALAAGDESKTVLAHVFLVSEWEGEIAANNEIEEILWICSDIPPSIDVGSIFRDDVLPRLKGLHFID